MNTTRRVVPGVAAAALMAAAPAAFAACPDAFVELWSYTHTSPFTVSATAYDTTFNDISTAHLTFDRSARTLTMNVASGGRMTARMRVVESFDVMGVPVGTDVPALLELRVNGYSSQYCGGGGCGVILGATLRAGSDSVTASANQIGPGRSTLPVGGPLTLPVTFHAGTPITGEFFLDYGTGPGGSAEGELACSYRILGLPAGVEAVTCEGASATPVGRASWGALKWRYR